MPNLRANELLGYPPDARLLIINADDFGMYHAVNEGVFRSLTDGIVRSTTVIVPCPWGRHALRLLGDHPEVAFGVHLTVVTDFADYRWGPLAPRDRVPSLLDQTGYFHRDEPRQAYLAGFELGEVEIEFRAQIEAVLAADLKPSHLDWHCLRDGGRPDVFDLTLRLAREYGLALRVFDPARIERLQSRGLPTNDHEVVDSTRLETAGKTARYVQMLRGLSVGLSEWAVHPALGTAEAQAIDGAWAGRAADFSFLVSQEARKTIEAEGIVLLDYRPLQVIWGRARAGQPA
ncbi:MAG: polysaccharide deacetylase family protein [Chloroflexota bacterium]|nr:polysaccharide deacetylase family protein [Chloroflexota bacterium]MDP9470345.1 polysaccharide deacetylase family protein [Chloroflexota bacterium]